MFTNYAAFQTDHNFIKNADLSKDLKNTKNDKRKERNVND